MPSPPSVRSGGCARRSPRARVETVSGSTRGPGSSPPPAAERAADGKRIVRVVLYFANATAADGRPMRWSPPTDSSIPPGSRQVIVIRWLSRSVATIAGWPRTVVVDWLVDVVGTADGVAWRWAAGRGPYRWRVAVAGRASSLWAGRRPRSWAGRLLWRSAGPPLPAAAQRRAR